MLTAKGFAVAAWSGAILFGVATIRHPVTYNPWTPTINVMRLEQGIHVWEPVHSALVAAVILWLGGLSALIAEFQGPWASLASRLWVTALAIWLVILSVELTALPQLAAAPPGIRWLAGPAFSVVLIGGYFAVLLMWLGVTAAGQALAPRSPRIARWGRVSGCLGVAGVIYSLLLPRYALVPLALSSAVPYIWTLTWTGWTLWSHRHPSDPLFPTPR